MATINILVSTDDFDAGQLLQQAQQTCYGAQASFIGYVRDKQLADGRFENIHALTLEHYPGMTEKVIKQIALQAVEKWPLGHITVVHGVGRLLKGEQIVFVAVASEHRGAAFAGCEFIMDLLKTRAPFWKKEEKDQQSYWVEAKRSDEDKAQAWLNK